MTEFSVTFRTRLDAIARFRWLILCLWVAEQWWVKTYASVFGVGGDWRFMIAGGRLLFTGHAATYNSPAGLHLYASNPRLQVGPLAFVVARPFAFLPGTGRVFACTLIAAAVLPVMWLAERAGVQARGVSRAVDIPGLPGTVLLGGLLLTDAWVSLAVSGHLDDAIVLAAMTVGTWAVGCRKWAVAGVAVGCAVASKPWGVAFTPVLFGLPRRDALRAMGLAGLITGCAWGPFYLADAGTAHLGSFNNGLDPGSGLWGLGVRGGFPSWTRYVQFGAGLVAGTVAAIMGRWRATAMTTGASRMLLEPRLFEHYPVDAVLGGFLFDVCLGVPGVPVWTSVLWFCTKVQASFHGWPVWAHALFMAGGTGAAILAGTGALSVAGRGLRRGTDRWTRGLKNRPGIS